MTKQDDSSEGHRDFAAWVRRALDDVFSQREIGVLIALLVIGLFFAITTDTFLRPGNLVNILRQSAIIGIMAVPVCMLIISGEFDLSIGSTFAMVPLSFLVIMENGVPMWAALPASILIGPTFGLVNGLLTTKTLIPSFIVTLGTMKIYRGLTLTISGGVPRTFLGENLVTEALGGGTILGFVDMPAVWLIIVAAIGYIILHRTAFGFKTYATGGNLEAARISGIKTDRVKIVNFCLVGTAAGFAGLVSLFFTSTTSGTMGTGYELDAIATSVVGGAMLTGGVGSVLGTFLGSFILAEIRNGLILNMVNTFFQEASLGLVIIIAVIINTWVGRTTRRK